MSQLLRDRFPQPRPLIAPLIPPRGAKQVGVHDDGGSGKIIYEMRVFDPDTTKANKRQKVDALTGEPMWRKHPTTGENVYPIMEIEPVFRNKRFILVADKNGRVRMQENFELSPSDIAEREQLERKHSFLEDLALEASKRGVTARELVNEIIGEVTEPGEVTPVGGLQLTDEAESVVAEAEELLGTLDTSHIDRNEE